MTTIPTLFPLETIDCDPPCPEMDAYYIVAYWPGRKGRWKVFDDPLDSEAVAQHEAERLPAGWRHKRVIHLKWGK